MASGKISVFAPTNKTSLPIIFTTIKKEIHEMVVVTDKFSLRAFGKVTLAVLCRLVPDLLFWALTCPPALGGHMLLVGPRNEAV